MPSPPGWVRWRDGTFEVIPDVKSDFDPDPRWVVEAKRKGSWKGGTIGSSIELKYRGDLHLDGFVRYCKENQMKFTGIVVDDEPPASPEAA